MSQLSIVNIANVNSNEISDSKIQDICSGNDSIPKISSSSDTRFYLNDFKSTAINVRDPKSNCDREKAVDMESSDFNVQTSEIPCSKLPDIKIAQNVSNISNEIMYANITDESKASSKSFKFDSCSDVCKIPLNLVYFYMKFIFVLISSSFYF